MWNAFLKEQAAKKNDAAQTLAAYDGFLQAHPALNPNVAVVVQTYKANTLFKGLKDPQAALTLLDETTTKYAASSPGSMLRLTRFKAEILVAQNRWPEVESLMQKSWPSIVEVAQQSGNASSRDIDYLAHAYAWALEGSAKKDERAGVLIQALTSVPALLEGGNQLPNGSLYEMLVTSLLEAGRKGEALSWAELQYLLCGFDTSSLERSTKLLARAWAGRDDFASVNAFSKAQSDASAPNPLTTVALPPLSAPTLEAAAKQLPTSGKALTPAVVSDAITLDLASGKYGAAMQKAQKLLQDRLDAPEGAQEVARVFKAADLNIVRANGFLAYLKGQGSNPFPDFYAKYGNGETPAQAAK